MKLKSVKFVEYLSTNDWVPPAEKKKKLRLIPARNGTEASRKWLDPASSLLFSLAKFNLSMHIKGVELHFPWFSIPQKTELHCDVIVQGTLFTTRNIQ